MRGGGAGGGHGDGEDGVGAEIGFVGRAVGVNHFAIERVLVGGVEAGDGFGDFGVHVADGFQDAFAEVARFVAVAEFVGFVFAGGCAGRNGGAADGAACDVDVGFDGGIAAGIDDFAADELW